MASSPSALAASAAAHLRTALARVDELWDDEEQLIQSRQAKRSAKTTADRSAPPSRACSACRSAKHRCLSTSADQTCPRCIALGIDCVYPEPRARGPKKRLSKTHRILRDIKRELEAVLAGSSAVDPLDEDSEEEDGALATTAGDERYPSDEALLLRNPLAVLAQQACEAAAPAPPCSPSANPVPPRERYFEGGLYLSRPEVDFSGDPVESGVLSLPDLSRLVKLYFAHLRPFFWLLLPEVHTVDFLRQQSPFLLTSIAYVASTFDPLSAHLASPLAQHAHRLMLEILDVGLKSLEVVQGFFTLSHWASPETTWDRDRSWQYLGQAWRMATELRIDLPLEDVAFSTYRDASQIGLELINQNRRSTWTLLFCGELSMSVQSGRADCLRAPAVPTAMLYSPTNLPTEVPDYNYAANLQVNYILARAIHLATGLRQEGESEGLREAFQSAWKPEMDAWRTRWPVVNPFIDVHAENNIILLNLMSLRFRGESMQSILKECKAAAIRTIQKVSSWEDRETQLPYCSNYVIVNIAYGAVILLRLSQRFQQGVSADLQAKILRIASILEVVGKNRPNATSFATLHAAHLRRLVASLSPSSTPAPEPAPSTSSQPVYWTGPPMPPTFPVPPPTHLAPELPVPSALAASSTPAPLASTPTADFPLDATSWPFSTDFDDFAMPMGGWWGWGGEHGGGGFGSGEGGWGGPATGGGV
ncbi:hypothetical protein JCM8097_007678 [Rhodosporidiobolus ruineniae]